MFHSTRAFRPSFSRRRLRLIWADSGYWGAPFADWIQARWPRVQVVASYRNATLPRRWLIERTFAWLGRC